MKSKMKAKNDIKKKQFLKVKEWKKEMKEKSNIKMTSMFPDLMIAVGIDDPTQT